MDSNLILVILYVASFAILYSLFSIHVKKLIKSRRVEERRGTVERFEKIEVEQSERRVEGKVEEKSRVDTVPEPIIVREDNTMRKIIAQLTLDELKVLKFLISRGGECYQMEIYRTLNLPKSTVTKIVHRLSERGLLIVERRGRYNYVKLKNVENVRNIIQTIEQVSR